ncbi:MAG: ATP-binding cassette domain-containing protein [Hyphomicrobiales bacterium]|nr:ATP-binding cassette domain-containing protein [Hyphomicrobiales bacterium]
MNNVLEVIDVTVRFGGVTAVAGANFTMKKGELLGFIGPNGAGKTTLMRVITGIVKPQEGHISLDERDLSSLSINERINCGLALAQQIVQPFQDMSLLDNVALACGSTKTRNAIKSMFYTDRSEERQRAAELLHMVGLEDAANSMPSTLPLGYLKRMEVARALALDPHLLLLDEPLAGLNQNEARGLADLIQTLNNNGQTILLIEHNLREVMRICPLLYVQDNGRPIAYGPSKEVMQIAEVRSAYLGKAE